VRRFLEALDRYFLLNPWLSRAGNIATALLLAGLVGGLVAVVLGFPTIPMVTTMLGVFLLGLRGAQIAADKLRPERKREVLGANCLKLADEIQAWMSERQKKDPQDLASMLTKRDEGQKAKRMLAKLTFDIESREEYEDQFAARVFQMVNDLQEGGYITEKEAQRLNYPKDQQARGRGAYRLRELGKRLC
jgi:hypothetical protein